MADLQKNLDVWNTWNWSSRGDEWSAWWGDTPALWFGALLPRVHPFLPAGTVLEIAPGYGRWTQYLKDLCDELVIVDLTERCIEHCRERFADATNISYHVNDGRSLEMVEDGSLDLVFSFDSLVHAEADVLGAYLEQLARKLKPDGMGFVHHSNIGEYARLVKLTRRAVEHPRTTAAASSLVRSGALIDLFAWRAESMTADRFAEQCASAGLACVAQEKISWESGLYLIDALSLFTPRGSRWERERRVIRNPLFGQEGRRMARLYAHRSFPQVPGRDRD
jgi:SAM-dependent methyltransferase